MPTRPLALTASLALLLLALAPAAPARTAHAAPARTTHAAPAPASTVAQYPPGEFLEGVAVDAQGAVYVTAAFSARIDRIAPGGEITTLAQFPAVPGSTFPPTGPFALVGTIAFAPDGALWATYANTAEPQRSGLYRVTPDGPMLVAAFPEGAGPNGITIERDGTVYVADSILGTVWRLAPGADQLQAWVQDPLLAPTGNPQFPGANGVKRYGRALYVSNPSSAQIVRIPLRRGGSPGRPGVWAAGVTVDDFAFDLAGNLYGTTHPFDTVVRIARDGRQEVLAGPDEGIIGPTAAAFGTVRGDRTALYVVTDGGLFGSLLDPAAPQGPPSVVRLEVGIPGLPLPGTRR